MSPPRITVHNRQQKVDVMLAEFQTFAERAVQRCLAIATPRPGVLRDLNEVDVVLVSDRRMAGLHRRFLDAGGATDVITFDHGEIFISTETAKRHAAEFGSTTKRELPV